MKRWTFNILEKMDGRFHFGHCIRVAGPSQCGKTVTLLKLLKRKSNFYPHPPKRIMWITGSPVHDAQLENEILSHYPDSRFFYEIPHNLNELIQPYDFWIFDDLSGELQNNREFTNFFTKTAHHCQCLMAYLTQNAYEPGKDAATRTRNCAYQIFFNNKADVRWVNVLGQQLLGNSKVFSNMFSHATREPYSCLLVDNRATTPSHEQFIGDAFTENPYFIVPHK